MDIKQIRLRNLRSLIVESGTIANLARMSETAPAYLSQILNSLPTSTGKPRSVGDKLARKLEQALNKSYGWMDKDHDESDDSASAMVQQVPLLNMEQALKQLTRPLPVHHEMVPIPIVTSELAYAIRVWDDSMSPKFLTGDIIVVDPKISPIANDYILGMQHDNPQTLLLRQLKDTNGRQFVASNSNYPIYPVTSDDKIIGKIIYRGEIF